MKTCTRCEVDKPLDEFPRNRASKDGFAYRCKICNAELNKQWRQKNPDKARANSYKQSAKLKERDPEYWNRWLRNDYAKDSAKYIAKVNARRARLLQCEGDYTAEQFAELCLTYGGICLCCESADSPLTVDHVVPLSKGGSNNISNIQPLCRSCNSKKGAKTIDYRLSFALEEVR